MGKCGNKSHAMVANNNIRFEFEDINKFILDT
jgi:hypothetical protein